MGRTKEQRKLSIISKRRCILCNKIKTIKNNFHIKRYYYNPDGTIKYKSYDTRCKSCMKDYRRKCVTKSPERYCKHLLVQLKHRASKENLAFNLNYDDLIGAWNKQNGKCYYTKVPLNLNLQVKKRNRPHEMFPSIDRQIPSLGYTKGNVVWCVYKINRMKDTMSHEDFVKFCVSVADLFGNQFNLE